MVIAASLAPLPLIPEGVLRQHQAYEPNDNRFRAAARLLQSLWRQSQGLNPGFHRTRLNGRRTLGSRLTLEDAATGRNFMSPAIARLARHELAYRERGALIEPGRFTCNLLASQALAINLFGPFKFDTGLAMIILRQLLPDADIAAVTHVRFEHSPARNDATFTNDQTAVDVAFVYDRSDGGTGLVAVEMKYSESMSDMPLADTRRYDDLAEASGLFKDPATAILRLSAFQQLFREHLLTQATIMHGAYDEAHFLVIAPRHNHLVSRASQLYRAHLAEPLPGTASFHHIDLEQVIEAYGRVGELDFAIALHDRYTDWTKVDAIVAQAIADDAASWVITPPAEPDRLRLAFGAQ